MCGGGDEQKVEETPEQKELARIAMERWDYAQKEFAPFQQMYMDKVDSLNDQGEYESLAGKTLQRYANEFSKASREAERRMTSQGIDPTSGKFTASMGGLDTDLAAAATEGTSRAQTTQSDRYVGGLEAVVAMGQGKATSAQAGLGDVAEASGRRAAEDAVDSFNRRSQNREMVGTGMGMATAYANNAMSAAGGASGAPNLQGQAKPLYDNAAFIKNF